MSDLQLALFPAIEVGDEPVTPVRPGGFPRRIPAGGVELLLHIRGEPVPAHLRRSPRARRFRLVVERGGLLSIVLPMRFPLAAVRPELEDSSRWILRTVERERSRKAPVRPLQDGDEISFLGARYVVRFVEEAWPARVARVSLEGREILIRRSPLDPRSPTGRLREWFREEAARLIPARIRAVNEPLGFPLKGIAVRDQRTKWGACSTRGNVSLNWRLALAPGEILDYVIVHELCHLRELNHSRRFWDLLRSVRPEFEAERTWLRESGHLLDVGAIVAAAHLGLPPDTPRGACVRRHVPVVSPRGVEAGSLLTPATRLNAARLSRRELLALGDRSPRVG